MIPLFDVKQIREADKYAIEKYSIPSILLMENAAASIKSEIFIKYPSLNFTNTVSILCGKGNNGGDGFVLARKLLTDGINVNVLIIAKPYEIYGEAKINFEILQKLEKDYKNIKVKFFKKFADLSFIKKSDFIVDAILGTGTRGELKNPLAKIISEINKINCVKISIDSPTGINLENSSGELIFRSDLTVTLSELKTGLFYEKGKLNAGKVVKGSIGIGESYFNKMAVNEYLIEPEDALKGLPTKQIDLQKYSAGKVFAIAGSGKMPGAGVFAINSSMISGSGAGYLAFPKSIKDIAQTQMNSAVVRYYEDDKTEYLQTKNISELQPNISWADSVLIGPGLGREIETQKVIFEILKNNSRKNFVIDADAIYALGNNKYKGLNLSNSVFTPHRKEFADLLGIELEVLKLNLLKLGRKFAEENKTHLTLKGAPTIIFNPRGEVFINTSGNSGLAKFGSGDVLTGIISAFIAQTKNIESSIISSVYLHGLIADLLREDETEFGMTPEKLISYIPKTIKFLRNSIV